MMGQDLEKYLHSNDNINMYRTNVTNCNNFVCSIQKENDFI